MSRRRAAAWLGAIASLALAAPVRGAPGADVTLKRDAFRVALPRRARTDAESAPTARSASSIPACPRCWTCKLWRRPTRASPAVSAPIAMNPRGCCSFAPLGAKAPPVVPDAPRNRQAISASPMAAAQPSRQRKDGLRRGRHRLADVIFRPLRQRGPRYDH